MTFASPGWDVTEPGHVEAPHVLIMTSGTVYADSGGASDAVDAMFRVLQPQPIRRDELEIEGLGETGFGLAGPVYAADSTRIDFMWRRANLVLWVFAEGAVTTKAIRSLVEEIDARAAGQQKRAA